MQKPTLNFHPLHKIKHWNDQALPAEFVELDKQAHKIVIAYFLAHFEKLENKHGNKQEAFLRELESKIKVQNSVFGKLLKFCDHLSAFLEEKFSIAHSIKKQALINGIKVLEDRYHKNSLNGID